MLEAGEGAHLVFFVQGFRETLVQKVNYEHRHMVYDPDAPRLRATCFPFGCVRALEYVQLVGLKLWVRKSGEGLHNLEFRADIMLLFEGAKDIGIGCGKAGHIKVVVYPGVDSDDFLVRKDVFESVPVALFWVQPFVRPVRCRQTGRTGIARYNPMNYKGEYAFSPWRCLSVTLSAGQSGAQSQPFLARRPDS